MALKFKAWFAALRWRKYTRKLDRQIADARKRHRPVKHLLLAKQAVLHDALRGAR